jgi:8-oxo-dGTP pyrophosphatase MutT (NUDIX family)
MEKVTAFITFNNLILLFKHPTAGIQIPAGTVELNENPIDAVQREIKEETGLVKLNYKQMIGTQTISLEKNSLVIDKNTEVYSQPDNTSFNWANFRRGIYVEKLKEKNDYLQVSYIEYDDIYKKNYITYQITGWIPKNTISNELKRYFFHFSVDEVTQNNWTIYSDNHLFNLFWADMNSLPNIVEPQNSWIKYCKEILNYKFLMETKQT